MLEKINANVFKRHNAKALVINDLFLQITQEASRSKAKRYFNNKIA